MICTHLHIKSILCFPIRTYHNTGIIDKNVNFINNAGVMVCPNWKTEDGFDMQMGTNHFGHFLFTELLMPLLRKCAASGEHPRIVIVSSMAHEAARNGISFDDINFDKDFN